MSLLQLAVDRGQLCGCWDPAAGGVPRAEGAGILRWGVSRVLESCRVLTCLLGHPIRSVPLSGGRPLQIT